MWRHKEEVRVQLHSFLTLALDRWVVSLTPPLLYPWGKCPQNPLSMRVGGYKSWTLTSAGIRNPDRPALNLVIRTMASQLQTWKERMRNDSKYENVNKRNGWRRAREREMVCLREAGGWYVRGRVRVRSVVKDRKYEWLTDGMREDKKGNMKLMRDWITGHQCRYEGQSYRLKGRISVKRGSKAVWVDTVSEWGWVQEQLLNGKGRESTWVTVRQPMSGGTVLNKSKWGTEGTGESGLRERIAVWDDRMTGWWIRSKQWEKRYNKWKNRLGRTISQLEVQKMMLPTPFT